MDQAYQNDGQREPPRLAVRRATDRCFHAVEEVAHEPGGAVAGYIVDGFLIPADEVVELRELDDNGAPLPPCDE